MRIKFNKASFKANNSLIINDFTWEVKPVENWAITGASGTGKTNLLRALHGNFVLTKGKVFYEYEGRQECDLNLLKKQVSFVFFEDQEINYNQFYYQQRYNSNEWEGTLTVKNLLETEGFTETSFINQPYLADFDFAQLLGREFIKLSNGETRKVLIIKALLKQPKLLLLDDPYVGLDAQAQDMINELITTVISYGTQVIIVTKGILIPKGITHVLQLENNQIHHTFSKKEYPQKTEPNNPISINYTFPKVDKNDFLVAFELKEVTIRYEESTILDSIDWKVRKGEKWALSGKNGAGKSMLISLLNADNPQAYANDLTLFDQKRGEGETIWDIKARIGFMSPEFHFYFNKRILNRDAILGGLYENPYSSIDPEYRFQPLFDFLIEYYNISSMLDRWFYESSTGQQRLILFIRTLLKNPQLLLLDEPFQGFDMEMIEKSKLLLDRYCTDRTLVFVSHNKFEFPGSINHFAYLNHGVLSFE